MALGAVRAGGILKSTGARRSVTVEGAQKAQINSSLKELHINGPTKPPIEKPKTVAMLIGERLKAAPRSDAGEAWTSTSSEDRQSNNETRSEIKHSEDIIKLEIEKRETMIRRLPKEFTYTKPAGGPGFYFILLITVAKDLLSIIIKIIEIFLAVTVVGGIIIWVIATAMDLFIFMCSQLYFFINNIPLNGKKGKIQILGFIIELIPILGFLPTETIALIWVRIEVNKEAKQKATDEMNEKIVVLRSQITEIQNSGEEALMQYAS